MNAEQSITEPTVKLSPTTIDAAVAMLNAVCDRTQSEWVIRLYSQGSKMPGIVATVTELADSRYVLSVQTVHGYFELHDVQRCVLVEPDEAIFVSEHGEAISGVVIGRQCTCSSFANVNRSALSADFTTLEPVLLLAAMQLGLAEQAAAQ